MTTLDNCLFDAQRLLTREFAEPSYRGYFALRVQFKEGHWLLVTKPDGCFEQFTLQASEAPAEFAGRILEEMRPTLSMAEVG